MKNFRFISVTRNELGTVRETLHSLRAFLFLPDFGRVSKSKKCSKCMHCKVLHVAHNVLCVSFNTSSISTDRLACSVELAYVNWDSSCLLADTEFTKTSITLQIVYGFYASG